MVRGNRRGLASPTTWYGVDQDADRAVVRLVRVDGYVGLLTPYDQGPM